jgi:hypothetical protein
MNIRRINIWPPSSSSSGSYCEANGIAAVVADPGEFSCDGNRLLHRGEVIDLVYNRLTDFSLDAAVNADLRAVFDADGVVVTPHPRAHALYADKRNLMLLSDEAALDRNRRAGSHGEKSCSPAFRARWRSRPKRASVSGRRRKRWFFKIAGGFGSRAAYRGDKLTKRVFEEILQGGYIAQEIVPPSEHSVSRRG